MRARLSFIAVALAAAFFVAATPSEAQTIRRFPTNATQGSWYRPQGSNVWMYPAPRYGYQIGGTRIYFGRPSYNNNWGTWNSWNYGYSNGYQWPYGYPSNYNWPYSN